MRHDDSFRAAHVRDLFPHRKFGKRYPDEAMPFKQGVQFFFIADGAALFCVLTADIDALRGSARFLVRERERERERESPSHIRLIHPIRIVSL